MIHMEVPPQCLPLYPHVLRCDHDMCQITHVLHLTSLALNNMIDPDANIKYIYFCCHVFTMLYSAIHGSPANLSPMV